MRKFEEKKKGKELAWKITVESDSLLTMEILAFGADARIIHVKDCHMFRLSESPTNIIFFPLHLLRSSNPLNLQGNEHILLERWRAALLLLPHSQRRREA